MGFCQIRIGDKIIKYLFEGLSLAKRIKNEEKKSNDHSNKTSERGTKHNSGAI